MSPFLVNVRYNMLHSLYVNYILGVCSYKSVKLAVKLSFMLFAAK